MKWKRMDIEVLLIIAGALITGLAAFVAKTNGDKKEKAFLESQAKLEKAQQELNEAQKNLLSLYQENQKKTDLIIELQNNLSSQSQKVIEAQEQLTEVQRESIKSLIGMESFCTLQIVDGKNNYVIGILQHHGKYPLYDLELNIVDVDVYQSTPLTYQNLPRLYKNTFIGTLSVGKFKFLPPIEVIPNSVKKLNVFFSSRNGDFRQQIILRQKPIPNTNDKTVEGAWIVTDAKGKVLTTHVSSNFLNKGENLDSIFEKVPTGATRFDDKED